MGYYGDFMGFQFGDYHSHDLGLVRVSDGSRYTDPSVANFTDTVTKIPGGDGTYYWDSFYSQRVFTIQCAFDNLTEAQIRTIRQVFNGKAEGWLIFDEVPFKKYRVKMQSPPQMKYIAFGEGSTNRVYKGELTLQFISYIPYAHSNFKILTSAQKSAYPNWREWDSSALLLTSSSILETKTVDSQQRYYLYNPGDVPTDLICSIGVSTVSNIYSYNFTMHEPSGNIISQINIDNVARVGSEDTSMVIDTARNLIYGINSSSQKTGTLYNKYITSGDFFTIPVASAKPTASADCYYLTWTRTNTSTASISSPAITVNYDYLYY